MPNNNPSHLQRIGKMLRAMREYRGMTQQQLAAEVLTTQATISGIEQGRNNFEINTLMRICAVLRCRVDVVISPE